MNINPLIQQFITRATEDSEIEFQARGFDIKDIAGNEQNFLENLEGNLEELVARNKKNTNADSKFQCENIERLLGPENQRSQLARDLGSHLSNYGTDLSAIEDNGNPKNIIDFEQVELPRQFDDKVIDALHYLFDTFDTFIRSYRNIGEEALSDSEAIAEIPSSERSLISQTAKSLLDFFGNLVDACSSFNAIDFFRQQILDTTNQLKELGLEIDTKFLDNKKEIQKVDKLSPSLINLGIQGLLDQLSLQVDPYDLLESLTSSLENNQALDFEKIKNNLRKVMVKLLPVHLDDWLASLPNEVTDLQGTKHYNDIIEYVVLRALYNSHPQAEIMPFSKNLEQKNPYFTLEKLEEELERLKDRQ